MKGQRKLKVLHTSDWHIGCSLYGQQRLDEFEKFFDWLAGIIERERVDMMLMPGDVFDGGAPNSAAQQLYYRFLGRVARSQCRHAVITSGNHDSASFLDAPSELLSALNLHVMGAATGDLRDEVLLLDGAGGKPAAVVCAVPFLRERDVRRSVEGEDFADRLQRFTEGIKRHYDEVYKLAEQSRSSPDVPIIAMGHLFVAGGFASNTLEARGPAAGACDGGAAREVYVGKSYRVPGSVFPDSLSYAALGHLHAPQLINGREHVRYCGSPIPVGFCEAGQTKNVCLVQFNGAAAEVRDIEVPCFRRLRRVKSSDEDEIVSIVRGIIEERSADDSIIEDCGRQWLEVTYEGSGLIPGLRDKLRSMTEDTGVSVLCVRNMGAAIMALRGDGGGSEALEEMNDVDVFERLLSTREDESDESKAALRAAYAEAAAATRGEGGDA